MIHALVDHAQTTKEVTVVSVSQVGMEQRVQAILTSAVVTRAGIVEHVTIL